MATLSLSIIFISPNVEPVTITAIESYNTKVFILAFTSNDPSCFKHLAITTPLPPTHPPIVAVAIRETLWKLQNLP